MGKINKALFSHESTEWETPKALYDILHNHFHFTMDVAASKTNAKCPVYLIEKDDALKCTWGSMNWCNPPYKNLVKWILKAAYEATEGRSTVMLLPARTDTKWFNVLGQVTNTIFLFHGRLTFGAEKGKKVTNAPFPSLLTFFGINYADVRALKPKLNGELWVIDKNYDQDKEKQEAVDGSNPEANGEAGKSN